MYTNFAFGLGAVGVYYSHQVFIRQIGDNQQLCMYMTLLCKQICQVSVKSATQSVNHYSRFVVISK